MKFTKMHGIGNDYIYINCFEQQIDDPAALAVALSPRRFSVGADGVILIMPSDKADFRMRMFNADGSEGKMCGNGSRCVGKFVHDRGLTDKTDITLETLGGIQRLHLYLDEPGNTSAVTVDMGKAVLKCDEIPMISESDTFIAQELTVGGHSVVATCVSMGNPHCVVFTDDIDKLNLEKIGPSYENNEAFPERTNTEFVEIIDKQTLRMRVWERGSGETWACGTGACAVCVAAVENGFCERDSIVKVQLRGGDLMIKYATDGTVYMTGPAEFVYDGEIK